MKTRRKRKDETQIEKMEGGKVEYRWGWLKKKGRNERNNRMMIKKEDCGVGEGNSTEGRKCKWEIGFPGSHSKTGPCWSLSIKRTQKIKERRRKKKREIPACSFHQARTQRPGCAPRRPAVPSSTPTTASAQLRLVWTPSSSGSAAVCCRGHSLGLPHDRVWRLRSSNTAACHAKWWTSSDANPGRCAWHQLCPDETANPQKPPPALTQAAILGQQLSLQTAFHQHSSLPQPAKPAPKRHSRQAGRQTHHNPRPRPCLSRCPREGWKEQEQWQWKGLCG